MKFHHHLFRKRSVHEIYLITSGKQMSNNYAHGFNIIDFVGFNVTVAGKCLILQ